MFSIIYDGKVLHETYRRKHCYCINLDLIDITAESTLNLLHDSTPNIPTAIRFDLLLSPTSPREPAANVPTLEFNIITETL